MPDPTAQGCSPGATLSAMAQSANDLPPELDLLTVQEYAERTGRRPSSVRRSIKAGTLPAVKAGRDWLILGEMWTEEDAKQVG